MGFGILSQEKKAYIFSKAEIRKVIKFSYIKKQDMLPLAKQKWLI